MKSAQIDVVVVGLGAMGAATLYQLARRGINALGIDRYACPHELGSSHGETRITRCAAGKGDEYVPLVTRSHAIWRELEAETGETLLNACGFLMIASPGNEIGDHKRPDFLKSTIDIAQRYGIPHEQLDVGDIAARFPAFGLDGTEKGYFEPGGGFVYPERCVAAQLQRAQALGAVISSGHAVRSIRNEGSRAVVETDNGSVRADRVVVCAGSWAGKLLGYPFSDILLPYRQTLHWFSVKNSSSFDVGNFPSYIWRHGFAAEDYFYGFPALPDENVVKVATEQYRHIADPDEMQREVSREERASMYDAHVKGRLKGVEQENGRSKSCLYTVTPDSDFIIDHHPEHDGIIVVSPCSGHGFKHSAAIGESVAQLIFDGQSAIDLDPFKLRRLVKY